MKSIKENIKLTLRGLRALFKLDKIYTLQNIFISFISPLQTYVNVYASAMLIDSLIGADKSKTWGTVVFILLFNAIFSLFIAFLNRIKDLRSNYFFTNERMLRSEKTMKMKYEYMENSEIHALTTYIDSTNHNGFNLHYFNAFITRIISSISNIIYACTIVGELIFSNEFSGKLKIVYFVGIITVICIKYFADGKTQALYFDMNNKFIKHNEIYNYYTDLYENYQSGKDIRIFDLGKYVYNAHSKELDETDQIVIDTQTSTMKYIALTQIATNILSAVLYIVMIGVCISGGITVGSIGKYITTSSMLVGVFGGLISQIKSLVFNNKYMKKYFEFLDLPEEGNKNAAEAVHVSRESCCSISFEGVAFKYPGCENYVLEDVTFEISPGDKVALVGLNGSGKTTIVKLLCRLYKPTKGRILLDGTDIWDYSFEEYTKLLGTVFQDFKIFAFTLGENLSFGNQIDRVRAVDALNKCGFGARFNTLEDGLDTYLYRSYDNRGVEISGGEAQKIALARAVYNEPGCVILDEPTSALDPIAEYEVYSKFQEIIDGQTAVYISHRLSSCRFCDKIIVLSGGVIAEEGSHDELLKNDDGLYRSLWDAQAEYYS